MSSQFDSTAYYRLSSDEYGPDVRLNEGYYPDAPSPLILGSISYSSENWQIFFQDDIYFLRNYDYGTAYQLAIGPSWATQPQLLPATGDLSQQWNITLWPDGTKKLVNLAVGPYQVLGVANDSSGNIIPVMNTAELGSHWTFDINPSAGDVSAEMMQPLPSIATPTTTAASSTSTAVSTATAAPQPSSTNISPAGKSKSISSGAIAGIVIGAVAVTAVVIVGALFMIRRKRSRARRGVTAEALPDLMAETYNDHATGPPPAEMTAMRSSAPIYQDRKPIGSVSGPVEMPP